MSARRRLALAAGALALAGAPAASARVERQLVADAQALAFTLRPTYDPGGAAPLHFYLGYTDAKLSTPSPAADGQASWYNFGLAETAAFKPPEECTPPKNAERAQQGLADVAAWIEAEAVPALREGRPPVAPGPTLPCSERLPGFAQSRYPPTATIEDSDSAEIFGLGAATGGAVRDGSFEARATDAPSQTSSALLAGVGVGPLVRVGAARTLASVELKGETLVSVAGSILDDVCAGPSGDACALRIEHLEFVARVERGPAGKPRREQRVVVSGVHPDLDGAAEEALRRGEILYEPYFALQLVSRTGGCGSGGDAADAGGLRLSGRGTSSGGGIMIGGACASGRLQSLEFDVIDLSGDVAHAAPPFVVFIPGKPAPPSVLPLGPISAPAGSQIVQREVRSVTVRSAPAWRTAPYWGSTLGALAALGALLGLFRRSRYVAPVWSRVDRLTRQFVRG